MIRNSRATWRMRLAVVAPLAILGCGLMPAPADAGRGSWWIGVRFGGPVYARPWPAYYAYPRPVPCYYEPMPVFVPSPVVVPQPVPVPVYPAPTVAPAASRAPAVTVSQGDADRHLQQLADADERVRADSVLQLGRARVERAVEPLTATLAGDRSPIVREAAARALGLIGSPRALTALKRAAFADADRDVRHSAQFAVDVIQTGR